METLVDAVEPPDGAGGVEGVAGGFWRDVLDLRQLVIVDYRKIKDDLPCMLRRRVEQIALRTETQLQRGDDLFSDAVEGRVCHLRELLCEIVEEQARTFRQHRDRSIGPHCPQGLCAVLRHRLQQHAHFFFGVTEGALATGNRGRCVHDVLSFWQVLEVDSTTVQPGTPGFGRRELALDLVVFDEASSLRVDEKHLARA